MFRQTRKDVNNLQDEVYFLLKQYNHLVNRKEVILKTKEITKGMKDGDVFIHKKQLPIEYKYNKITIKEITKTTVLYEEENREAPMEKLRVSKAEFNKLNIIEKVEEK